MVDRLGVSRTPTTLFASLLRGGELWTTLGTPFCHLAGIDWKGMGNLDGG